MIKMISFNKMSATTCLSSIVLLLSTCAVNLLQHQTLAQGTTCPVGLFGVNCSMPCHCLNGFAACSQVGCNDYQCDRGWNVPPECQSACDDSHFGSNCAQTCHCMTNRTCNKVTGFCMPDGQCYTDYNDEGWGSTACQVRLPKLRAAPVVDNVTCQQLNVTWHRWTQLTDIGDQSLVISSYTIESRLNFTVSGSNRTWNYIADVPAASNVSQSTYTHRLNITNQYDYIEYRIITNWLDFGKLAIGLPSPASVTVRPVDNCIYPPGEVQSMTVTLLANNVLLVTWSSPANLTAPLMSYTITQQVTGIGDCNLTYTEPVVTYPSLPSQSSNFTINNLKLWMSYTIELQAVNIAGAGLPVHTTVVTHGFRPSGVVSNIQLVLPIQSRSAVLSWSPVSCYERGGPLLFYSILATDVTSHVTVANTTSNTTTTTINNLQPYTTYSISVSYNNQYGAGNYSSQYIVTTAQEQPSVPINVQVRQANVTVNSLYVAWQTPANINGVLRQYRVTYWMSSNNDSIVQISVDPTHNYCNITLLTPATDYSVQVQAANAAGLSNLSNIAVGRTLDGLPASPVNLRRIARNETTMTIAWNSPTVTNGRLTAYKVSYSANSRPDLAAGEQIVGVNVVELCVSNLSAGVQYQVSVYASTERGFGAAAVINAWTEIGSPVSLPIPVVISTNTSIITVSLQPAVLSTGPVSMYFIVVNNVSTAVQPNSSTSRVRRSQGTAGTVSRVRRSSIRDPVEFLRLTGVTVAALEPSQVTATRNFVVGDGLVYGGYQNRRLDPALLYVIHYVIASSLEEITKMNYSSTVSAVQPIAAEPVVTQPITTTVKGLTQTDKILIGVLVPVCLLLLIVAIVLLIYCCCCKHRDKSNNTQYTAPNRSWIQYYTDTFTQILPTNKWTTIMSIDEPRYVNINEEVVDLQLTDIEHKRPAISFDDEYSKLPDGTTFSCTIAQQAENGDLNRFPHLLAYDHSRVKLHRQNADNDYINANYIAGYDRRRKAYIAAPSPFNEQTICDFWLMVYQEQVTKIVFLAQLVEGNIVKCEQYWSDDTVAHVYGEVTVMLLRVQHFAHFIVRTFRVEGRVDSRIVRQYQFLSWPEHGVPHDPLPFLEFHMKVSQEESNVECPVLVHCGTGVSRTAVFIAVDYSLAKAKQENCVNVFRCCASMRQCRPMMVRTLKQYKFVYDVLFEALLIQHNVVRDDVNVSYRLLNRVNQLTKQSYFHEQFMVLERYTEQCTADKCTLALSDANYAKNRFSTLHLLSRDSDRPVLHGPLAICDYINAVYVDSYFQQKAFVVTQTPLTTTLTDFWSLIIDQRATCIVAMNGPDYSEDTCVNYWPTLEGAATETTRGLVVTLLSVTTTQHFIIRRLQLATENLTHIVTQFQLLSWKMYDQVPWSRDGFIELLELVQQCSLEGASNAPVVVHCADGASQSGLFCAGWVVCEKMRIDKQVDIFHTVKAIKLKRFHFINTLAQYKFCFKLLWDYTNTRLDSTNLHSTALS